MSDISTNYGGKTYFIGVDKIVENDLNEVYDKYDLSNLKNSIMEYGLKQPLSVVKSGEDSYRLIAGHSRLTVIKEIYAENKPLKYCGKELRNQIPCIFENNFDNEDDEFLNLTSSNVYRKLSEEETKNVIIKTASIYEKRKNLPGYEGKKRDVIARLANVSSRTVDKYLKDDADTEENNKILSVNAALKLIDKITSQINEIDLDEYGRTDRNKIKDSLIELSVLCKKKK